MLDAHIKIQYDCLKISVDFTIPHGTSIALMGPSGAGKSSILNVLAGFTPAPQSRITFQKQRLDTLKPADRPLTILFQEHNLFTHLDVWKNIAIGLDPRLHLNASQKTAVKKALQWVGLAGFDARLPATLSGGQKQRVALARCLARDRPLLLLDEPFTGLDQSSHSQMRDLVQRLCVERKLTLILSTHDIEDAKNLCEQIIEI